MKNGVREMVGPPTDYLADDIGRSRDKNLHGAIVSLEAKSRLEGSWEKFWVQDLCVPQKWKTVANNYQLRNYGEILLCLFVFLEERV